MPIIPLCQDNYNWFKNHLKGKGITKKKETTNHYKGHLPFSFPGEGSR